MSDNFVEEFLSDCIDNDIVSPKEICDKVVKRSGEITDILKAQNNLRVELKNLNKVLRHFGHDSVKRKRKKKVQTVNPNASVADLDQAFIEQIVKICNFVNETSSSVTPRSIMDAVGNLEADSEVYVAIKWLCENGILYKNDDRSLEKGERWDTRPTKEALATGT